MSTARACSVLLLGFIGAVVGLVLAMVLMSFERACPVVVNVTGAPAAWLFERWHAFDMPPQGDFVAGLGNLLLDILGIGLGNKNSGIFTAC